MEISAELVRTLRDKTSAGMMDCKKALVKTHGNIEEAILEIRKSGLIKAEKKVDRLASEGVVVLAVSPDAHDAVMIELNSETDFVARDTNFMHFADAVVQTALTSTADTIEELKALMLSGAKETVEESRQHLIAKLGENIQLRRMARVKTTGVLGTYLHAGKMGVLVSLSQGDVQVAKDIAMHVAASRPLVVSAEGVPADLLAKERAVYAAQASESGKPPAIIEKMVEGRIQKYLNEVSLMGQPFVKNPDVTIAQFLKEKSAAVETFVCFKVGEGLEKVVNNFAEEVMQQARG